MFEIFRLREKDIPVENFEIKSEYPKFTTSFFERALNNKNGHGVTDPSGNLTSNSMSQTESIEYKEGQ